MYDLYDPYGDDEERQRALEALGTAGPQPDPTEPDPGPAIQALAKEADRTALPPQADRVVSQSAPANAMVQQGDDSGPGLNGWAVAADLVFNRGRGLGGILGMAEQQKRDYIKTKGAAAEKSRALDQADRRIELDALQQQNATSHQFQLENQAIDRQHALDLEHKTDNERADKQLSLAEKREAELAQYRTAELADREDARKDRALARDDAAQARKDAAELKANAAKEKSDQTFAEHFGNKTEKAQKAALALKSIDEIIAKYPNQEIPGLGLVGTDKGDWMRALQRKGHEWTGDQSAIERDKDEQAVANAATELQQMVLRGETGAVAHPSEEQLDKIRTGFGAGRTQEQRLEALNLMREMVYGDLRAHGAGNETVSRRALELNHLDPDKIFGGPAKAAPPPSAAAGGDSLPVTNQRARDVPKVNDYLIKLQKEDEDLGVSYGR
jgi:hypothetical protein